MQPFDYSLGNLPNPGAAFTQGLAQGDAMLQIGERQQAQAMALQAAQQQAAAQQARAESLRALAANPNPTLGDYRRAMTMMPDLSEQLGRSAKMLSEEQQQAALSEAGQTLAALRNGRPDIAAAALRRQAELLRKQDPQGAKAREDAAQLIELDPTTARDSITLHAISIPGGDKLVDAIGKIGTEDRAAAKAPGELRKVNADASGAEADAVTKGVTAKFAESQAVADLEEKGWDIKALQADIGFKREANRIAAMNAAAAKEGNTLKREELLMRIDDAVTARDTKLREKAQAAETGAAAIDNMLNTIERVKKSPGLREVVGSVEGSDYYPTQVAAAANALNPFTSSGDDRADAIALIGTLGSQAFLSQIPNIKGMGQLSNVEGEKLQQALQNLTRKQSEPQFRASLDEAARLLMKGRANLSKASGVPLGKPDVPAAPGARPPLDSFFK